MKRNKGFTLIELMIVVAIIAIIAAVAIPSLLGAKKTANEATAIANLRTISTCCEQFRNVNGRYPTAIGELNGGATNYIDEVLASGNKSGYDYNLADTGNDSTYTCNADPDSASSGDRHFFVDESGVIRSALGGAAGVADTPIE